MGQLRSLGVRNLRSFSIEKQLIDIKKINILVGKNSCGKSTFARVFPLLKQSLVAKTSQTPILWNGSIIDFGDFSTALRDGENYIAFDFQFKFFVEDFYSARRRYTKLYPYLDTMNKHDKSQVEHLNIDINLSLIIEKDNEGAELTNTVILQAHGMEIAYQYNNSKFYSTFTIQELDDKRSISLDLKKELEQEGLVLPYETTFGFLPDFFFLMRRLVRNKSEDSSLEKYEPHQSLKDYAVEKILQKIKKYFKGGTSLENIHRQCYEIQWVRREEFIDYLNIIFKQYSSFTNKTKKAEVREEILKYIYPYSIILSLPDYMDHINMFLSSMGANITYIAPVRAVSERYYRYQNLSVEEMDSTGMNLPMVINSLDADERFALSLWVKENFNFEVKLEVEGQHYELLIKSEDDKEFHNISDMGFGYSQLLPIIVSIWLKGRSSDRYLFSRRRGNVEKIYVIEQPELHLHPALQYQFGIMLAKIINEGSEKNIKFIIETHSKSIIDALGDEIRKSTLNNQDVGIYLFEKDKNTVETLVRSASFSYDGYLQDWPLGFLTA